MRLDYSSYLKLDELLQLQQPQSDAHDEWLFIVVHQVYELWFNQFLREGGHLIQVLAQCQSYSAMDILRRMLKIAKIMVAQTDITETLNFKSFKTFRDALGNASGLQSGQFREIEVLLGWKNTKSYKVLSKEAMQRVEKRLQAPNLWEAFCTYCRQSGGPLPISVQNDGQPLAYVPNKALQRELLALIDRKPEVGLIAELLVDVDEGFQEWRYRHIKMVERTIGGTEGTGGTSGLYYLKQSLYKQAFPDLWQLRDIETYG